MQLQDQVIPFPMAQRLKELGVKQKSLFYHIWNTVLKYEGIRINTKLSQKLEGGVPKDMGVVRYYSAFTLSEVLMPLPTTIAGDQLGTLIIKRMITRKQVKEWSSGYWGIDEWVVLPVYGPSLLHSICALLIHLLESNLITVQEVNSRI